VAQKNSSVAGTNHSKIDQNTPTILDKENIPPVAHTNDIARANAMVASINANQTTNEYLLVIKHRFSRHIWCITKYFCHIYINSSKHNSIQIDDTPFDSAYMYTSCIHLNKCV